MRAPSNSYMKVIEILIFIHPLSWFIAILRIWLPHDHLFFRVVRIVGKNEISKKVRKPNSNLNPHNQNNQYQKYLNSSYRKSIHIRNALIYKMSFLSLIQILDIVRSCIGRTILIDHMLWSTRAAIIWNNPGFHSSEILTFLKKKNFWS